MLLGSQAIRCIPAWVAMVICRFRSSMAASISAGVWFWRSVMQELSGGPRAAQEKGTRTIRLHTRKPLVKVGQVGPPYQSIAAKALVGGTLLPLQNQFSEGTSGLLRVRLQGSRSLLLRAEIFGPCGCRSSFRLASDPQLHLHRVFYA